MADLTANVRYMVDDVEAAVDFYTTHLGFELLTDQAPAFADVQRGSGAQILLDDPSGNPIELFQPR